ncbi:unnamed protein product, partial [Symbiodinium necroappetens]
MSPDLQRQIHDLAFNDTGLPRASVAPTAERLETWCKQHSWKVCALCGSVQPQHLKEADLRDKAPTALAKCKNCSKPEAAQIWVPSVEEVPGPLRGLSRPMLLALRPLDIDCGPEWKADYGYYFHSAMIRLSWSEMDVLEKIHTLDNNGRKKAKKAFNFLMASDDSSYRTFVLRHRRFLREHPWADGDRRKRPLRFIEEDAIECCLWPHLYWDRRLCETSARLADVRRQSRAQAACTGTNDAGDHELVQFVFDLFVWSDVGGKKGALRGVPMWQMEQLGRQRLGLAGPEALHLAHLLTELFREWVCGGGRKFGEASSNWKTSFFGGHRGDGSKIRVNFVGRLEFQDGTRREVTQDYHGRAAVHLHGLVFAEEVGPAQLHTKVVAVVPPEGDPLRGYVLGGQAGRTGSG